jgi:hypothetical protein
VTELCAQVVELADKFAQLSQPFRHAIENAAGKAGGQFLVQRGDLEALLPFDFAFIRADASFEHLEQCRLATAIAPHQANAFASLDAEIDTVQQRRATETQVQITDTKNGHGAQSISVRGVTLNSFRCWPLSWKRDPFCCYALTCLVLLSC